MEKRLVLALVLCFVVMILVPTLWPKKEKPEKDPAKTPAGQPAEDPTGKPAGGTPGKEPAAEPGTEPGTEPEPAKPAETAAEEEWSAPAAEFDAARTHEIGNDVLHLVLTEYGGGLRDAYLKKYGREPEQSLDRKDHWYRILSTPMTQAGGHETRRYLVSGDVRVLDGTEASRTVLAGGKAWTRVALDDPRAVAFELALEKPAGLKLRKVWTLPEDPSSYDVSLHVEVRNEGAADERKYRLSILGPAGLDIDRGSGSDTGRTPVMGFFQMGEGDLEEIASVGAARNWDGDKVWEDLPPAEHRVSLEDDLGLRWLGTGNLFFMASVIPDDGETIVGASLWRVYDRLWVEGIEAELGKPFSTDQLALLSEIKAGGCFSCIGGGPKPNEAQAKLQARLKRDLTQEELARFGKNLLATTVRVPMSVPTAGAPAPVYAGRLFLGPRSGDVLTQARYELMEDVRDTGWPFWLNIARWLLGLLAVLQSLVGNYGVAIILLTLVVRGAMFPLSRGQQLSMQRYSRNMQRIKPKLDVIRKKHKDNPKKLNQEMMKLYKTEGVSMVPKGCLVAFLQIPIFIGLFQGLRSAIELRHAGFLWIEDLTGPDRLAHLPFFKNVGFLPDWLNLLPLLMTALWWLSAKMAPKPVDPQQAQTAKMMQWMPIIFGVMLYNYTSGLALYMCVSSLWSIVESRVVRKIIARETEQEQQFLKPGQES